MNWLVDQKIRQFAELAISKLPDYFFGVAASSTGKFHPSYALGNGGLVRHTKAAVKIAHELLEQEMYYTHYSSDERDMMIVALILHDGWKHGVEARAGKYTVAEHPIVCAEWVRNTSEFNTVLSPEKIEFIAGCIASHMGMYDTDFKSKKKILPRPKTAAQKFVHQCDLLASRRWLNVDFGDNYYVPESERYTKEKVQAQDEDSAVLQSAIADIVTLCTEKIATGIARNTVYKTIADLNDNNRNPNSIKSLDVAEKIRKALEELND